MVASSKTILSQPALFSVLNINVETKKCILVSKEAQVFLADSNFFKVLPEFLNHYPCIIYTVLLCANTEPGPHKRDVSWFKRQTLDFHSRGHKLFTYVPNNYANFWPYFLIKVMWKKARRYVVYYCLSTSLAQSQGCWYCTGWVPSPLHCCYPPMLLRLYLWSKKEGRICIKVVARLVYWRKKKGKFVLCASCIEWNYSSTQLDPEYRYIVWTYILQDSSREVTKSPDSFGCKVAPLCYPC